MTRQQRRYHQQKLRKLKLVPCDFKMTAAAGLGTILEVFDQTPLAEEFKKCLPERVAHNLLRWMALIENPERPHYSKKLRKQYVFNPGRLIRHARGVVLKVMRPFYEEVTKMREAWQATPIPVFSTA